MAKTSSTTLFDKLWDPHVVASLGDGHDLLHVDRHYIHDLIGPAGFADLRARGLSVRNPELNIACVDHTVSSAPGRTADTTPFSSVQVRDFRRETTEARVRLYDLADPGQGIIHITGPELGLSLPGLSIACGDSHTCTHGGLGALAFGIGSSEMVHVLATQTIVQRRPKRMRVRFEGALPPGVEPKDMVLHLIGQVGTAGASGHALEFAGSSVRALGVEGRMTICNLSIELGAKMGTIAPDDTTFEYVANRRFSPQAAHWDSALAQWRMLHSDEDAVFDREHVVDTTRIAPQITWGTSPEQTIAVGDAVPDPEQERDPTRRAAMLAALDYMGLTPGTPIAGVPVDWVFIGSCANSRLSDLQAAAAVIRGRKVARSVRAWVVPGSEQVKRDAEALGLHRLFVDAGFEWREPGCSMCVAVNGETLQPGQRSVSTSNRNFVGRQGAGARTHLASPSMAAAAALAGTIVDARHY